MLGRILMLPIAAMLLTALTLPAPAPAQDGLGTQDEPVPPVDKSEPYYPPFEVPELDEVEVRIVQVEITVWPRSGDPGECLSLDKDDFEVLIKGAPRDVIALDRLGDYGLPVQPEESQDPAAERALQYVVIFDLAHLDSEIRDCGRTMPMAFSWAREMLETQYRDGDRVMLATYRDWPQVETPWLQDKESILDALDRLEVGPNIPGLYGGQHRHDVEWFEDWSLFLEALGYLPGRKDMVYLGDDICVGCTSGLQIMLPSLGARAQRSQVVFQTVDTLGKCRMKPGVPRDPDMIAQLANMSGGKLYEFGTSAVDVVETLREMLPCNFQLAIRGRAADERKRGLPFRVSLNKPGFRLTAPERIEDAQRTASDDLRAESLRMLAEWGHGLFAQGTLWSLSPTGKRKGWNAMVMARVRDAAGSTWPPDVDAVDIKVVVRRGGKTFGEFSRTLEGEELENLRRSADGHEWMIPVQVASGTVTVQVTASIAGTDIGASSRTAHVVPLPPRAGEIHSWFLARRGEGLAEGGIPLPSTSGNFAADTPPTILGYGCPTESSDGPPPPAMLVRESDGERLEQVTAWLDVGRPPVDELNGCRWVAARVDPDIEPGLWSFHSRFTDDEPEEKPQLSFRIRRESNEER